VSQFKHLFDFFFRKNYFSTSNQGDAIEINEKQSIQNSRFSNMESRRFIDWVWQTNYCQGSASMKILLVLGER
jgi:hypothetical protein